MTLVPAFLLQDDLGSGGLIAALLASGFMMLVMLALVAVFIAGMWKVFVKAGQPGWAVLIPIYNLYILLQIAGRPAWWILLMMIPLVNIVVAALVAIDVAKAFGQSAAFGVVMLFLLSGIGYLMLGFGNYQYVGNRAVAAGAY
jgi:hypothetical protein